ncbi:hypothetical protein PsYK624_172780 [Phanerochaete sordida]|uniref:DUF6532 domain-containing protein n=1 Tax=Phanerochaete sordida TaxID=48140 RepID=A0A9P3GTD8_9APHY|nr:hypothetical protein PsYK624_172780 [Phanerochaete sordida]
MSLLDNFVDNEDAHVWSEVSCGHALSKDFPMHYGLGPSEREQDEANEADTQHDEADGAQHDKADGAQHDEDDVAQHDEDDGADAQHGKPLGRKTKAQSRARKPRADRDEDDGADAQHDKPRGRKTTGKMHARKPQADRDEDDSADAQYDKPRGRKTKAQSRQNQPRPRKDKGKQRAHDPPSDYDEERDKSRRRKNEQLDEDSASNYEQSAHDSDEDTDAAASIDDEDDDLAEASINPEKLKALLAAEEANITIFDDDDEEDEEEDKPVSQPARRAKNNNSKTVAKLRAEEPALNVEEEDEEADDERELALTKTRSRTRAAVAARVAGCSNDTGHSLFGSAAGSRPRRTPPVAGPSHINPMASEPAAADVVDTGPTLRRGFGGVRFAGPMLPMGEDDDELPNADVPLLQLAYGRWSKIKLSCLNPRLRDVIKLSHLILENQLYKVGAFPDELKFNKLRLLIKCLKKAAEQLDEPRILKQLRENTRWARELVSNLETRLSQLRSVARAIAILKVPVHYKLSGNPPDLEHRLSELLRGMRYIFPGDILRGIDATKAFRHPCISDILSLLLFKARLDFLNCTPLFFEQEWEGEIYKMVPAPLICLVATAIHSVIRDMADVNDNVWHFSVKRYVLTYESHEATMAKLAKTRPGALERLLRDTYNDANNGRVSKPAAKVESSWAFMDVDNMEVL